MRVEVYEVDNNKVCFENIEDVEDICLMKTMSSLDGKSIIKNYFVIRCKNDDKSIYMCEDFILKLYES